MFPNFESVYRGLHLKSLDDNKMPRFAYGTGDLVSCKDVSVDGEYASHTPLGFFVFKPVNHWGFLIKDIFIIVIRVDIVVPKKDFRSSQIIGVEGGGSVWFYWGGMEFGLKYL